MNKKLLSLVLVAALAMSLLAGCGSNGGGNATTAAPAADTTAAAADNETEAPAGTTAAADTETTAAAGGNTTGETIKVGYAQVGHESDWRTANTKNYQDVFSAENGYELSFVGCDNDNAKQLEAVRGFIQQELDYIVIAPIETAGWDTVLQEAQDAGIPVIIADREIDAPDTLYDAWVGTNTKNEGITAGNWLAEYLDGKEANILVIEGSVGSQAGGQEVMESFIKSYKDNPGFNVVVCQNDNEAYGAMDAMKNASIKYGVDGDVIIISFDATHDGLQYTLDGAINCNVECNPIQAGVVEEVIQAMATGNDYEKTTLVEDQAFVAPGIESEYATTMTQEILDGRAY